MRRYKIVLLFVLCSEICTAQTKQPGFTINGTIRDAQTGEALIGATISVEGQATIGTVSNDYGFYSLSVPSQAKKILVRYVGYIESLSVIDSTRNQTLNVTLKGTEANLKEVEITAQKKDENVRGAQMSVMSLEMKEINKLPVIFGERDILKSIQLLPGVQPAGEGNSGYYVRGGSSDQNLILLDEAPVYNAAHMLGFFSTFNSDAIKDVQLYKGNMPSEYGGRIASVLDVKMKEGNNRNFGISGGIGLITSRLAVEGPIVKNKGSFFISGRTTYADLFLKLSNQENLKNSTLNFFDINAKANYRINDKNRIFISGYFGQDNFSLGGNFGIKYGNSTATARWNWVINQKIFSNTSFIFNDFKYSVSLNNVGLDVNSSIRDFSLKEDIDYYINSNNKLKFGLLSTFHTIVPGEVTSTDSALVNTFKLSKNYGWENGVYVQHEVTLWEKLNINYGIRLSTFSVTGPSKQYSFNDDGTTDTLQLNAGQFGKTYFNPEPRFSTSYNFYKNMSLKLAYSRNTQSIQQLTNTTTSNPTDRWVLSSNNIKPQISDQVSAGYFVNFYKDMFEVSLEGYYKWIQNQIDYRDGSLLRANETVERELIYGLGRAYGLEVFFKKRSGKFTGWISYTLSASERKFNEVNGGLWFHSKFDRTHDLSVVLLYDITPRINISAVFTYYTGNATTFPSGKYEIGGSVISYYGPRNEDRMPNYHRLDLSANFILKKRKNYEHDLNISCYNVYGQKNAYSIDFSVKDAAKNITVAKKTYLFRWVPSITYNFKFTAIPKKKNSTHEK